jgi:small subunit ribosomal protein S4
VNGQKLDVPSAQLSEGDSIGFTPRGVRSEFYKIVQETIKSKNPPSWLSLDVANMTGRMTAPPTVVHGETHLFNENIIIEYYSR